MRRMTLGAFGWRMKAMCALSTPGLNAPCGARCFLMHNVNLGKGVIGEPS